MNVAKHIAIGIIDYTSVNLATANFMDNFWNNGKAVFYWTNAYPNGLKYPGSI